MDANKVSKDNYISKEDDWDILISVTWNNMNICMQRKGWWSIEENKPWNQISQNYKEVSSMFSSNKYHQKEVRL